MKEVSINDVPTKVTNFTVAVNERGRKEPTYFKAHAWRGLAETCAAWLKKGRKVMITGPVRMKSYKDSNQAIRFSLEVRADEVEFLDSKPATYDSDDLEAFDESEFPCA